MKTKRLNVLFSTCCVLVFLVPPSSAIVEDAGINIDIVDDAQSPGYTLPDLNPDLDPQGTPDLGDPELDKDSLLGIIPSNIVEGEETDLRVTRIAVVFPEKEPLAISLGGGDRTTISMKENEIFATVLNFIVSRQAVSALRYQYVITANGQPVDKASFNMGDFAVSVEPWSFKTPYDQAPGEGSDEGVRYKVVSKLFDENTKHLEWEWDILVTK